MNNFLIYKKEFTSLFEESEEGKEENNTDIKNLKNPYDNLYTSVTKIYFDIEAIKEALESLNGLQNNYNKLTRNLMSTNIKLNDLQAGKGIFNIFSSKGNVDKLMSDRDNLENNLNNLGQTIKIAIFNMQNQIKKLKEDCLPYFNYEKNNIYYNDNVNGDEIITLKNDLNKAKKIIQQQKSKVDEIQNKLNNTDYNKKIKEYENIINQKEKEIKNLNLELNKMKNNLKNALNKNTSNNNNTENTESNSVKINEMMCVNFISSDQNIHYSVPCIGRNTFAEVEEKLYQKFPEYRETNNSFLANGTQVLRFKTISENKIGNGLPVTLITPD